MKTIDLPKVPHFFPLRKVKLKTCRGFWSASGSEVVSTTSPSEVSPLPSEFGTKEGRVGRERGPSDPRRSLAQRRPRGDPKRFRLISLTEPELNLGVFFVPLHAFSPNPPRFRFSKSNPVPRVK